VSVDIVVPVFNEAETIPELIERLRAACPDARLVFVGNASTDDTIACIARHADVVLVRHERNLGYGRSLLDGIAASDGERIVMIDADLEYLPEDVPAVVAALDDAPACYGSRFLAPTPGASPMPLVRMLGNRLVTTLFNVLFRCRLTDLYTGIRAVRRDAFDDLTLRCDGFELVLELAARLVQAGRRVAEVPVGYVPRERGRSKMRHVPEFAKFAWRLIALRVSPGR